MNAAVSPDEPEGFTHTLTSAATTSTPTGLGANSVFALGGGAAAPYVPEESLEPKVGRKSPQRDRLLQTLQACGELNTDGISEAMGISLQSAADLAWKCAKAGMIAYAERDGRKFYRTRSNQVKGFERWLEAKASAGGKPAQPPVRGINIDSVHGQAKPTKAAAATKAVQGGGLHSKALPIEPWDYIVANDIGFLEGNAIEHLTRWKDGNGVEGLQKALHCVQKAIEVNTKESRK